MSKQIRPLSKMQMNRRYKLLYYTASMFLIISVLWINNTSASQFGTYFCEDQDVGDTSDPGVPVEPTRNDTPYPLKDFEYDNENYDIFEKEIHNRPVIVAIAKDVELLDSEKAEIAAYVFYLWSLYWQEYGGFPYPSYTVVLGKDVTLTDASGVGMQLRIENDRVLFNNVLSHEIYHAWDGNVFRPKQERWWFGEGATVYYDTRQTTSWHYKHQLPQYYYYYQEILQNNQDMPLEEQIIGAADYDHAFTAQKGALVVYLVDCELNKLGHHLGEVTRLLYQRFGNIEGANYDTNDILNAVNDVSGEDFTDFFNKYIYGTEVLPLLGDDFGWICHKSGSDTTTPPSVDTVEISSESTNSASGGGDIVTNGGGSITSKGVCWSNTPNPTINDTKTSDGSGDDSFTSSITGLSPSTTYHVRAYATNSAGTAYGQDLTFTTTAASYVYVSSDGVCGGKPNCYTTIESAVAAAENGSIIKVANNVTYSGSFTVSDKAVTIDGGWDTSFGSRSGMTKIQGAPVVSNGSFTMQQVNIVP